MKKWKHKKYPSREKAQHVADKLTLSALHAGKFLGKGYMPTQLHDGSWTVGTANPF